MPSRYNPELRPLLSYWYFGSKYHTMINEITSTDIINTWINIWFAKGERQKVIDEHLKTYKELLDKYTDHTSENIYEYMVLIVLYDQIPRNIYRGTAQAYAYDQIARKYIEKVLPYFETLHLIFKLTIVIGLVHSENIADHELNIKLLQSVKSDRKLDDQLSSAISTIVRNHRERVQMFGRIPERNKYLGRISTVEEEAYMRAIY